jgi:hypothetical protein
MADFVDYMMTLEHILIMASCSAALALTRRLMPTLCGDSTWARLLPAMPIVLCSIAVWLPGLVEGSTAEKALLGVVLGSFAGHAHKLVRQTVFGNDKRIRDHQAIR